MAGKRPYSQYDPGPSSDPKNKRPFRRSNNMNSNSLNSSNGNGLPEPVFRILCPATKIGGVIGKGGSIIKSLRFETGAKIKIEEPVAGSEERVVVISSLEDGPDNDDAPAAPHSFTGNWDERWLDEYTQGRDVGVPAQMALFKVHSRILDADKFIEDLQEQDYSDEDGSLKVVTRMLVPENQVGCLLGKRGKIIEQMREETGSQIRILPSEQLPTCALSSDEVVQVVGDRPSVKRALFAISTRLLENPPKDRLQNLSFQSYSSRPFNDSSQSRYAVTNNHMRSNDPAPAPAPALALAPAPAPEPGVYQLLRPTAPGLSEYGGGRHMIPMDEELVFRVLCPADRIGSIIGKSGSVIQQLRDETGAKIKVADAIHGSDERVIIVAAVECPDEDLSPAQEAVFHIQDRMREGPDSENVTTRLLVPSNHVGCLLGKGGNIIMEMRKQTRANIRVLSKGQLPKCALDNDEVVQIIGEIRVARDALVRITSRLRANLYREKTDNGRPDNDYGGYQRSSSPAAYPSYIPAAQASAIPTPRSPRSWMLQNDRNLAGLANLGSFSANSFGLGTPTASSLSSALGNIGASVVTTTRIEVLVPQDAVTLVQNGNLPQICKITGAKINLVGDSGSDSIVEISGTPEQTRQAKDLVEAFCAAGGKL